MVTLTATLPAHLEPHGGGGLKISEGVPQHTHSPPKFYTEKNKKLAVTPHSTQSTNHELRATSLVEAALSWGKMEAALPV